MSDFSRWPLVLPMPLLKGHGYTLGDDVLVSSTSDGIPNHRRRFTSVQDALVIKLIVNSEQSHVFDNWFENDIASGADWFVMPIKTPAGVIDHQVHFKPPLKVIKPISQSLWMREFALVVRNRVVISNEEYSLLNEFDWTEIQKSALISEAMEL